jgi:hypothetical protein
MPYGVWPERTPNWSIKLRDGGVSSPYQVYSRNPVDRAVLLQMAARASSQPSGIERQLMVYGEIQRNPLLPEKNLL